MQPEYTPQYIQTPNLQKQQQQQDQQQRQQQQQRARKAPARITRVLEDLMVFVETMDPDPGAGLVFKPDKIEDYHGETLNELNFVVGAIIPEISWDPVSLKVRSVSQITPRPEPELASMSM